MESLSSLRDMYLQYNANPPMNGQRGGGNDNEDTDTESEEESWRQVSSQPQSNTTEDAVKQQLIQYKSDFYHTVMPNAPSPLDQKLLLNTILETDLASIANVLINSLGNLTTAFSTSLIDTYNRNNGKETINVNPQRLNEYRAFLNNQAIKCISACRDSLAASGLSHDRCKLLINDIFITRVYSFLPEKESGM